jgi:hypothetical protein
MEALDKDSLGKYISGPIPSERLRPPIREILAESDLGEHI